ncbi:hypothetical protein BWQ93_05825 [Sphingopyxis sp. QXT-31]|uniref:MerR family transcriptional regulator n=1 Tax=Sphingopyxis sp. QXT-31 TaxID=1357916 RepID=UPI000979058A|nr:MerR family transcriptional regulator [Sphingopyxis sp. QXT-31]APZ98051.1 hypothetical protein BWQ93_05825 [Sphingopyxis sp. QXT-31]
MSRYKISGATVPTGPFTRGKVARFTGLQDEVLSHWTKEGLLVPINDASGPGRPKEFDQLEVQKAAVLKQMREFGCGIDALKWFASIVDRARVIAAESPLFPLHRIWELAHVRRSTDQFLEGKRVRVWDRVDGDLVDVPAQSLEEIALHHLNPGGGVEAEAAEVAAAVDIVKKYPTSLDFQAMLVGPAFTENYILDRRTNGIFLMWPTPKGWELYEDSDTNMSGLMKPPLAGIMIYVTRVMRDLWMIDDVLL